MAVLGIIQIVRHPGLLIRDNILKFYCLIFLTIWVPMFIATIDAYHFERSIRTTTAYIRFFFAGIFIINSLAAKPCRINFVVNGIALMVGFWVVDATIQFFIGVDLFGYPEIPGHIAGMFYPELQLPHICSILAAFLLIFIYQNYTKSWWPFLLLLPLFFVIFIAGRRATWIMLGLNCLGFLLYLYFVANDRKKIMWCSFVSSIVILLMLIITCDFPIRIG